MSVTTQGEKPVYDARESVPLPVYTHLLVYCLLISQALSKQTRKHPRCPMSICPTTVPPPRPLLPPPRCPPDPHPLSFPYHKLRPSYQPGYQYRHINTSSGVDPLKGPNRLRSSQDLHCLTYLPRQQTCMDQGVGMSTGALRG